MPADDSSDYNRPYAPVMAPHSIDTLAIVGLHQQLYTALSTGQAPWFYDALRQPHETADLTDKGRRKMPALMSGADTNYLALTHRQIDTIRHAGRNHLFDEDPSQTDEGLTPRNLTAQLKYRGRGNPFNTHIASSVGNCCPGLELDFRSVWKRAFEGITLVEHDNYVREAEGKCKDLLGHRLLSIEIPDEQGKVVVHPVVVQAIGPSADGSDVGPWAQMITRMPWSIWNGRIPSRPSGSTVAIGSPAVSPVKDAEQACACDDPGKRNDHTQTESQGLLRSGHHRHQQKPLPVRES